MIAAIAPGTHVARLDFSMLRSVSRFRCGE
jgi:hypothetical protein